MAFFSSDWPIVKLKDIAETITKGSTPTSYGYEYKSEGINFIKTENIDPTNGSIFGIYEFIDNNTHDFLNRSKLKANDLLFSIAGTIGRVGIVTDFILPANTNQALAIVRPKPNTFNPKYLFYVLNSPQVQKDSLAEIVGVGRANLSLSNLGEVVIPSPDIRVQSRIVSKLDSLFSELDKSVASLKKAQEQLKVYRQAVLKAAFEGKLTGDSTLWQKQELSQIAEVISGFAFKSDDFINTPGVPVIKIANVGYGIFVEKGQEYLPNDFIKKHKSFQVKANDILLALTRPITNDTTKVCLYPSCGKEALLNQRVSIIRISDISLREYLYLYMQSTAFKNYIKTKFNETLQPNLSPKDLKTTVIPIPPEQNYLRIKELCLEKYSNAEYLNNKVEASISEVVLLRQSILKSAFKGTLDT